MIYMQLTAKQPETTWSTGQITAEIMKIPYLFSFCVNSRIIVNDATDDLISSALQSAYSRHCTHPSVFSPLHTLHHRTDTWLKPDSQQKKCMCSRLVGLNQFILMTMQAVAQEIQALSIPGRDSETPEVINSRRGCWRSAWHPTPDSMFLSSVFC